MEADKNIKQPKIDIIGSLPPEIVQSMSLYLTPEGIDKASRCSKLWNKLFNLNYYWYMRCRASGYTELIGTSVSRIYEKYSARFRFYWQLLFNYNQLQFNWTNDIFTTTSVDPNSFSVLNYFDDEVLIATNKTQYKIFIIDSCTGQIKKTITLPYPYRILRLVKYQNLLVIVLMDKSDNRNKKLQVFTIEGKLLLVKKLTHLSTNKNFNTKLKVYKTLIAISDFKKHLQIIDFKNKTITYETINVCYTFFGEEIIAIGKTNGLMDIFHMNYIRLRRYDHGVRANINKIMISQDYMITLAENMRFEHGNHNAYVWNLKDHVLLYKINGISICYEEYTCSIYQDKFIYIKESANRRERKIVVLDISTGNKIFDIVNSSYQFGTSLSKGDYMFITTISKERTGGTAYIHCVQSGKEITSINDIYDEMYSYPFEMACYRCNPLRLTATKLAYITNKGDLLIRNYEKFIH